MKIIKMFLSVLFLCLIVSPLTAHGQGTVPVAKSLSSSFGNTAKPLLVPKKSLSTAMSYSPADYPLVTDGTYVASLYDSYGTYQDITFNTVSNYTTDQLDVQLYYDSDLAYYKDPILNVEVFKDIGGSLQYIDATEFDTTGYYNLTLHNLGDKSLFSDQQYIYLRVGVSEYSGDTYYSDVTQFKVKNPFYNPPVVDNTPPAKPTVYTISDKDTSVKGKAEPNSTIIVKNDSSTLATGTANSDGTYSVTIAKQKAGSKVTVYAKDTAGNTSSGTTVTVIDKTPPAAPTVNSVGDNQTIVTGKTEAGSKVVIYQGSSNLGQATATSTGYFTIKIASTKKAGTVLTVYATDSAGNKSSGRSVTVVDKTPPAKAVVNKVTYQSTYVSGKAEAGCKVYIYKGTTYVGSATADSYGNFKVTIKPQTQGSSLEIIVMDKAGNQSVSTFAKVY
jgi:hypothetical protein